MLHQNSLRAQSREFFTPGRELAGNSIRRAGKSGGVREPPEDKAKLAEAEKLHKEAGRCKPADAMQKLDAERAREKADG
jgi:hypothetical protein